MSNLLIQLVKSLVAAMAAMLTPTQVKLILDKAFDTVEEKVKDSKTHWDDVLVLPMITALRKALGVEDDD
ncbi:hypothetical protein LCGC14_0600500 [marine sediment metagenome]|uniref:Uncharacterized protein n=1 Tax=marine sediment metagenome TaxID=412755 RepID=A0A0F9RFG1_9ZZZZ